MGVGEEEPSDRLYELRPTVPPTLSFRYRLCGRQSSNPLPPSIASQCTLCCPSSIPTIWEASYKVTLTVWLDEKVSTLYLFLICSLSPSSCLLASIPLPLSLSKILSVRVLSITTAV